MIARKTTGWLIALVLLVTVLNAVKPLEMDDGAFYANAVQSAKYPLDPYGFTAFWSEWPEPGNWAICPPLLPYWWAIAIHFFPNSVLAWKLWMLPWGALFVFSLHALLKRFAAGMEMPLVWMTALSPSILPAVNLMLDVPATGLGLAALCVGIRAIERSSAALAAAAGIMAALAIETKYTAMVFPVLIFACSLLHRRWWLGVLSGLIALSLFVVCELLIGQKYGMSHFLFHLGLHDVLKGTQTRSVLIQNVLRLIGGLGPAIGLIGLAALNAPRRALIAAATAIAAGYAALFFREAAAEIFLGFGVVLSLVIFTTLWQIRIGRNRDDLFLLVWLLVEIVAFVEISPFTASRRVMGLLIVMTMLVARLAWRRELFQRRPVDVAWIVAFGAMIGFGFYAMDVVDASAQKQAALQAGAVADSQRRQGQQVWFAGHWGFQFYLQRFGFRQVVPDRSLLHRGDWLILPHAGINIQHVLIPLALVREVDSIQIDDPLRLSMAAFYNGGGVPIQHRVGNWPRVWVSVYQVTSDFVPPSSLPAPTIIQWAIERGRPLPPQSVTSVLRAAQQVDPQQARAVLEAIQSSGPAALNVALEYPNAAIRDWAADAMTKNHSTPR